MLISCIVPIYNQEENLLRNCIESILKSNANFELLLVNNASTNNVDGIIDSYCDNRIRKLYEEKKGVVNAYCKGIQSSTGDYIIFVDSDDYIDKKLFDDLYSVLNKKKYDIINYGFFNLIDGKQNNGSRFRNLFLNNLKPSLEYEGNEFSNFLKKINAKFDFLYGTRWCNCYKKSILSSLIPTIKRKEFNNGEMANKYLDGEGITEKKKPYFISLPIKRTTNKKTNR